MLERANRGLGRLDGVAKLFPDPKMFHYMVVRKEALLSSQIEGTQSSFSDLLLYETDEAPGKFRRSQNWIGGSRPGNALFVPPPPERVMELMGQLERFLHNDPVKTPLLVKAALAHVQFETIHPFRELLAAGTEPIR